jgi:hypothetical protein
VIPYETIYETLAIHYHNSILENEIADTHIENAVTATLDIRSTTHEDGTNMALALLRPIANTWTYVKKFKILAEARDNIFRSNAQDWIRIAVKAINNFAIRDETGTQLEIDHALANFVNRIDWPGGGCVPLYWCWLSEDAGFDTSLWSCCPADVT